MAGVVSRSLAHRANVINSMQIAEDRGLAVAEKHDRRTGQIDSVLVELETDSGVTSVEGAVATRNQFKDVAQPVVGKVEQRG